LLIAFRGFAPTVIEIKPCLAGRQALRGLVKQLTTCILYNLSTHNMAFIFFNASVVKKYIEFRKYYISKVMIPIEVVIHGEMNDPY